MKIIAFDLDGTALAKHTYISEKNKKAFQKAQAQGVMLIPATGRIRSFVPKAVFDIGKIRYLIASNGAEIYDCVAQKTIYTNPLQIETAQDVIHYLHEQNVYFEIYLQGEAYAEEANHEEMLRNFRLLGLSKEQVFFLNKKFVFTENFLTLLKEKNIPPEKINIPYVTPEKRAELYQGLQEIGQMQLTSSLPNNMEANHITANKGSALKFLAEYLRIPTNEIMAIGDNGNDLEMLQYAGISVAMGNGTEAAKSAATYITGNCEADGVAEAILGFLN